MTAVERKQVELSESLVTLRLSNLALGESGKAFREQLFYLANGIFRWSEAEIVASVESLPGLLKAAPIPDERDVELAEGKLNLFLENFRNRWCFEPRLKDAIDELGERFCELADIVPVGSSELTEAYRGYDLTNELISKRTVAKDEVTALFSIASSLLESEQFTEAQASPTRDALDRLEVVFITTQAGLV